MKKIFLITVVLFLAASHLYSQEKTFSVIVKNKTNINRYDSYVALNTKILLKKHPDFNLNNFVVLDNGKEIPYQVESVKNKDSKIGFVLNIKAKEKKAIIIKYGKNIKPGVYASRTYAELAVMENGKFDGKRVHGTKYINVSKFNVPSWHIDHDGLFKCEGPQWESDKVAYRFYLDWRNAIDITGKKVSSLVLKNMGVKDTIADNNESFHTMAEWGMDIFKVGNSLGIGSLGIWDNGKVNMLSKIDSSKCEIAMNGPVKSEIITSYYGWNVNGKKYSVESKLSILAGSRLTEHFVSLTGNPENIVTGLAKYHDTKFIKSNNKKGWNYIALYGKQSLAGDSLGIAVFYKNEQKIELAEDDLSYIVKLKPLNGIVDYFFGYAWEQELNGIKNQKEFIKYLDEVLIELNNPLIAE